MGERGPAPKPTALRRLEGGLGHHVSLAERKRNEPRPELSEPEVPDHLDDDGRAEWFRIVEALRQMKMLHASDRGVIAAAASAWSAYVRAERAILDHGDTFETQGSGMVRARPEVGMSRDAQTAYLRASDKLGLNPSARSRIRIEKPQATADRAEDYFTQ